MSLLDHREGHDLKNEMKEKQKPHGHQPWNDIQVADKTTTQQLNHN